MADAGPVIIISGHEDKEGERVILKAVAERVGIGVDENAAIMVQGRSLRALGSGTGYAVDGGEATRTNMSKQKSDRALSMFGVRIYVLSSGDRFDLEMRRREPGTDDQGSRRPD